LILLLLSNSPGPAFQLIGFRIPDEHKWQPIGYHDETRLGGGLPGIGNDDKSFNMTQNLNYLEKTCWLFLEFVFISLESQVDNKRFETAFLTLCYRFQKSICNINKHS